MRLPFPAEIGLQVLHSSYNLLHNAASMELNRYHYFMIGLFLFFCGLELQTVESITLTPEVTKFLAERTGHPVAATSKAVGVLTGTEPPLPPKTIAFPEWTGYAALSASAVLVLYSLMLPKPG